MASEGGSPAMRSPTAPSLSRFASTSSLDSLGQRSPILNRLPSSGWTKGVGMGGDPSLQKKRARNLLRDYYGLAQAGGPGDKGKAREEVGFKDDDLDSPKFDPARHAERLMASETVADLLKTTNRLNRQARELDGERQGLVYNHHHELVEASGTIGKVRSRFTVLAARR